MKINISIDIIFNKDLNLWEVVGREFFDSLEDIEKVGEILCIMEKKFETYEKAFNYIFYVEYNTHHSDNDKSEHNTIDNRKIICLDIDDWVLEKDE